MKVKKVMAVILACSVLASFTGCSKIRSVTLDEFESAWDRMGAEEIDVDDFESLEDSDADSVLFDGIYFTFEPGDIDMFPMLMMGLKSNDLDLNLDDDDIDTISIGARAVYNLEYFDPEEERDITDFKINGAAAIHIAMEDNVDLDELEDGIDDLLSNLNINLEDLSSSEYRKTSKGLSLMLRIDFGELCEQLRDSDAFDTLSETAPEDVLEDTYEQFGEMEGDLCLIIVAAEENIVVIVGGNINDYNTCLPELMGQLGLENPESIPVNHEIVPSIVEAYVNRTQEFSTPYNYYSF